MKVLQHPLPWIVIFYLSEIPIGSGSNVTATEDPDPIEYVDGDLDEPVGREFEGQINDVEIFPGAPGPARVGMVNLTTPVFSIPYEDYQIQIFAPSAGTPRPTVFYYLPALTLLPNATEVALNNRTGLHCTSIKIKMWDHHYLRHIQTFLSKHAGIRKSSILPVPFKWVRFDYLVNEHFHLETTRSQWRPLGNHPQTVSLCFRCATSPLCHLAKESILEDPARFVSGVMIDFAYKLPSSKEMPLCTGGPILSNSEIFNNIRSQFAGATFVFLRSSDYLSLVQEFVGWNMLGRVYMGEFVASDEFNRATVAVHPLLYHNVTSAQYLTEQMWNLTYHPEGNPGAYAVNKSANPTDKIYGLNITDLIAHPPTCSIPLRVTGRDPDYAADLHMVINARLDNSPDPEEKACQEVSNTCINTTRELAQRIEVFEVALKSATPTPCPSPVPCPSLKCASCPQPTACPSLTCPNYTREVINRMDSFESAMKSVTPVPCPPAVPCPSLTCPPPASCPSVTCAAPEVDPVPKCLVFPKTMAKWTVRDAETSASITKQTIAATLQDKNGTILDRIVETTSEFGELVMSLPIMDAYVIVFEVMGYHRLNLGNFYHLLNFHQDTFMEPLLFISHRLVGSGMLSGRLYGIPSNRSIPYGWTLPSSVCRVEFRTGLNNLTGPETAVAKGDLSSEWKHTLPMGHYTAAVRYPGYDTAWFTIVAVPGKNNVYDFSLMESEPLKQDAIRIIWRGGHMDGHAFSLSVRGPVEGTSKREHIVKPNMRAGEMSNSSDGMIEYHHGHLGMLASILIKRQLPGIYRVVVYDWYYLSKVNTASQWILANSSSAVQVYRGDALLGQYFVPNRQGNAWSVVEIDGIKLTPLNEMRTVTTLDAMNP